LSTANQIGQKTVLIAWEIGAGLGHVGRLKIVCQLLMEMNLTVILASKQPVAFNGIRCLPAPKQDKPHRDFGFSFNYTDNLAKNGLWHADSMEIVIAQWLDLFEQVQPDLVICEHAPLALLAANLIDLPRAMIGTGFSVPPSVAPMPSLQPWMNIPLQLLQQRETDFVVHLNSSLRKWIREPLKSACDLFQGAHKWPCTSAELDHYEERSEAYLGPLVLAKPHVNAASQRHALLYLRSGHRQTIPILEALHGDGWSSSAFLPDCSDDVLERAPLLSCTIHQHPLEMSWVAEHCSVAVTHGGFNTAAQALLSGIKLLVCPIEIEQALLGWRLQSRGLATSLGFLSRRPDLYQIWRKVQEMPTPRLSNTDDLGGQRFKNLCSQVLGQRL
jgi:hypothetical protein